MLRTQLLASVVCLVIPSVATAAPVLQVVNGIPSFDTNLGTLLSATVTIDPPPQSTEVYDPGVFENIGNHSHLVNPLPIQVAGLDSYAFPPTPTNFVNPQTGQDHAHIVNLPSIVETYTGGDLAWFLDPLNGVFSLPINSPPTSMSEGHNHAVNLLPVVPQTRFLYEPAPQIPEPGCLALLAACCLAVGARRR